MLGGWDASERLRELESQKRGWSLEKLLTPPTAAKSQREAISAKVVERLAKASGREIVDTID